MRLMRAARFELFETLFLESQLMQMAARHRANGKLAVLA